MPDEGGWKTFRAFYYLQWSALGGRSCQSPIQLGSREGHLELEDETTGNIFYKSTQILLYADDIDIIGLRLSYLAEAYRAGGREPGIVYKRGIDQTDGSNISGPTNN